MNEMLLSSRIYSRDRELVVSVAQELGGFTVDSCVSESTTHVVFTQPRRTLNVLMGIARGCWLVSIDWVRLANFFNIEVCLNG